MGQTGSYAPGFHEGHRSEYLAQYFFSSLGTAVPVPGAEDSGLDLHCTVADIAGRRAWPRCFYTVQIKSKFEPWIMDGAESVNWIATLKFPVFLCIVDKRAGRFRVYQTLLRHCIHACPPLPSHVEFSPEDRTEGVFVARIAEHGRFSLSAPILEFGLDKLLDDEYREKAKNVITDWVERDDSNTHKRNMGISLPDFPTSYRTNEQPAVAGKMSFGSVVPGDGLQSATENLVHALGFVGGAHALKGNKGLAVRALLLLRRLDGGFPITSLQLLNEMCAHFGLPVPARHTTQDAIVAGLDKLDEVIEAALPDQWKGERLGNARIG